MPIRFVLALSAFVVLASQVVADGDDHAIPLQRYARARPEMGVEFEVIVYAPTSEAAESGIKAAFARIHQLNGILSDYDENSEINRWTQGAIPTEQTSDDLRFLLDKSKALHQQTDRAFDPTMGSLTKLWRRARRRQELPEREALELARQNTGLLLLEQVGKNANLRLDFGGIAKGYAAEEALKVLEEHGLPHALVRGAGDIAAGDAPPDAKGWVVGVAPLNPDDPVTEALTIVNRCVSTSGDARQHLVVDGKRYSHIIDPRTGMPVRGRSSVTVVAPHGWQADGLATAFSVLGPERSLKIAAEQKDVQLLMVVEQDDKQVRFRSDNWPAAYDGPPRPSQTERHPKDEH